MDSSVSIYLDSRASPQTLASRKRKVIERSVVRVKMGEKYGKVKNEGPPSDSWSWRKYGQKPIKGSPFPRGYYRCSTSKGCSAKKQVERCRTDASMLVITYTSTHNHPSPGTHSHRPSQNPKKKDQPLRTPKQEDTHEEEEEEKQSQDINYQETSRKEELEDDQAQTSEREGHHFHYIESPLSSPSPQEMMINQQVDSLFSGERSHDITLGFMLDEEPINASCLHHDLLACSSPKSEGNDFFDELEELPTALPFTSFMKNNYFRETIPPVHS